MSETPPEQLGDAVPLLTDDVLAPRVWQDGATPCSPCLGLEDRGELTDPVRAGIEISFELEGDEEGRAMQDMRDMRDMQDR